MGGVLAGQDSKMMILYVWSGWFDHIAGEMHQIRAQLLIEKR